MSNSGTSRREKLQTTVVGRAVIGYFNVEEEDKIEPKEWLKLRHMTGLSLLGTLYSVFRLEFG